MAIQFKRSSVVGKAPLASDLEIGEIAINLADRVIYTKDSSNTVVRLSKTEIADIDGLIDALAGKVDVVEGKGLSTEDFTTAEKSKLAGVEAGATANQTDAYLLARANHTGEQAIGTITGLADLLQGLSEDKLDADEVGVTVASLDGNGKVPLAQINDAVLGQVEYMGTWNAATNTPTLPTTPEMKGDYYVTDVAGTFAGLDFEVGDWIISNGSVWQKVDNTDAVASVNGKTGVVVLNKTDVGLGNVDNTSDANKPVSTAQQEALDLKASIAYVDQEVGEVADDLSDLADVVDGLDTGVSSVSGTGAIVVTGTAADPVVGISAATQSAAGSMSAADKTKLDGVEAGAQANTVNSVAGKTGTVTLDSDDVGLGNVENYAVATQAEAEAATVNNVYMTPVRVKQLIESGEFTIDAGTF